MIVSMAESEIAGDHAGGSSSVKNHLPLFALTILSLVPTSQAFAISRYQSLSMTCAAVHDAISRERAVILRHPSAKVRGMTLYDRYVSDSRSCETYQYAESTTVPTKDTPNCPVRNCEQREFDDNQLFHIR